VITGCQIRASRALLNWSAVELANNAGLGVATIRRIELNDGLPSSNAQTLQAIKKALEIAGVEFIGSPDDRPGVRLREIK
jgi:transcriptional regulator with XRE-family HTH domain